MISHLRLQAGKYLVVCVVDEVSLLLIRAPLPLVVHPTEVRGATFRHFCSPPLLLPCPGDKLLFSLRATGEMSKKRGEPVLDH